jgi:taurine dioxygenase
VDTSYVRNPPAYTALRTVRVPEHGGETLFTNQYRAYETLPADLRERLRGRTVRHVVTGVSSTGLPETQADHPVFAVHPISGRTSLYLSTPERCVSVSGLSDAESRTTIAFLYSRSTAEENVLRHSWSPGDVVIWDNRVVLHRADHAHVSGDRVMHRGMVTF